MVLLDDPLSAVDHAVAETLFHQAICDVLKDRCVVLVTHHPHFIARCQRALEVVDNTVLERDPAEFATHESSLGKESGAATTDGGSTQDLALKEGESSKGKEALPERRGSKMVLAEDRERGKVQGGTYWVGWNQACNANPTLDACFGSVTRHLSSHFLSCRPTFELAAWRWCCQSCLGFSWRKAD